MMAMQKKNPTNVSEKRTTRVAATSAPSVITVKMP